MTMGRPWIRPKTGRPTHISSIWTLLQRLSFSAANMIPKEVDLLRLWGMSGDHRPQVEVCFSLMERGPSL
jgi:hypothetical protein